MDPEIWGPSAWMFLHTITLNYPENPTYQDKHSYKVFFDSLKNVIPCPKCRGHYKQNLIQFPIQLNSKKELSQWLIDIHNQVNIKNNKRIYSFKEVNDIYNKLYNPVSYTNTYLFIILIICIFIYIYNK
jgi:FAD-linked sulfhydryl oxidase